MIPFGSQTVTLYHRERLTDDAGRSRESWMRVNLSGCSWLRTQRANQSNNAVVSRTECTCRIPAGQRCPDVGDVLVLGECNIEAETALNVAKILDDQPDSFRVDIVGNFALEGMPLPHYLAKGAGQ